MLEVYTDGSCLDNPGPGGWSAFCDKLGVIRGGAAYTSNNAMELVAIREALLWVPSNEDVTIYSDSTFAINIAKKVYEAHSPNLIPVANQIEYEVNKHKGPLQFVWISRASHLYNILADKIANEEARKFRRSAPR